MVPSAFVAVAFFDAPPPPKLKADADDTRANPRITFIITPSMDRSSRLSEGLGLGSLERGLGSDDPPKNGRCSDRWMTT